MSMYLGIDTSNYTTSVCLYDSDSGEVISKRKLLPVKDGELGLRQSDAVFHHVQQLPALFEEAFGDFSDQIKAIGVSYAPRTEKGSYMPCFTVGTTAASILSSVLKVPVYRFSHQQGHIAAALYSVDRLDLLHKRHIAFIARFAMEFISSAVVGMSEKLKEQYGDLPFVYAGGVMSDSIIRENLQRRFDCVFAKPEFSSDNAAGTAVLAFIKDQ